MKKIFNFYRLCFFVGFFVLLIGTDLDARRILTHRPQANSQQIQILDKSGNLLSFRKVSSTCYDENEFTWSGGNEKKSSYLTLAVSQGHVRGVVLKPEDNFQFNGTLDEQKFYITPPMRRQCGGCRMKPFLSIDPRIRNAAQTKHTWRNSDAGQIDLMVVYPTAVKNAIGSLQDTKNEINNAVAGANLCFRNSEVQIHLRLVHIYETDYEPTGNLDLDLERLTQKDDGFLDDIHNLRDQYGADIVTLLSTDSDMGGLANTLSYPSSSFEDSAFNVCVWDQIGAPVFTLAHEIGHNMGCLHNREDASDSSQSSDYDYGSFAYGKRWFSNGKGFRTVMAYNDSAKSYENSIPFFSNPSVSYQDVPTGNVGQEDNAQALTISAPYVSNFRQSKVQGILPSVFSVSINEGNYTTLWVRLSARPDAQTLVNISLFNENNFLLGSSSSLTFNENNWNLRQPVQVIALQDEDDLDESGILTFSANGLASVDITLSLNDGVNVGQISQHYFSGVTVNGYGYGVDGVTLNFSGGLHVESDLNGSFLTSLDEGFSGIITPSKSGYTFTPQSISINSLENHSLGNTFVASRASVIYVDEQASGKNDGTSWEDAFNDLSIALALVDSFSEVWVAKGKYLAGNVRSSSFVLPGGVSILGGFAGGEINSSERDFSTNETILSGDIGVTENNTDNSFHVVVPLNGSVLDGFIIEDGNATENYSDDRGKGAGLWAEKVGFEIRNCEFRNNWALQGGGAVWLSEVNATFSNCNFSFNQTGGTGSAGAIWSKDSRVTIESSTLFSNKASYWGGALRIDDGNLSLNHCTFYSNESSVSNGGGAIYQNSGDFNILLCSFNQNQSTYQGGAILIDGAEGSISDTNFTGNLNSGSNGGGALFIENSSPIITRSRFLSNTTNANNHGGAIKLVSSNAEIENCIFKYNQNTQNSGGAISIDEASVPTLENNEFYQNSSASRGGAIYSKTPVLTITGGLFRSNYANLGGGVATSGTSVSKFNNVKILGNEANASNLSRGGFLYLGDGAEDSEFVNCIIVGNKSAYRHGVYSPNGETRFLHCSILGNHAEQEGGVALLFGGDSVVLENSIMWNNNASDGNDIWVNLGTASANYSLFDPSRSIGEISGASNINQDPLFYDAFGDDELLGTLDDDLRLLQNSPALDMGDANVADLPLTGLSGITRDAKPDLGAYEFFENASPTYGGSTMFSVYEGNSSIATLEAVDEDGHDIVFSLVGGEDKSRVFIESQMGTLHFKTSPDYEFPDDSNEDNQYEITIEISDGYSSLQVELVVRVLDLDETAQSPEDSRILINGYSLGNDWREASWFGTYYTKYFPWVYHSSMGWVYIIQAQDGNAWMWQLKLGWMWTDIDIFPYFLINSTRKWGFVGSDSRAGEYYLFETGNEGWSEF